MADLGQTSQNFGNMLQAAGEKALGNSDADLKRVKFAVTSLKGGLVELDAQKRFLQGARGVTQQEQAGAVCAGWRTQRDVTPACRHTALLEGQQSAPGDAESERVRDTRQLCRTERRLSAACFLCSGATR